VNATLQAAYGLEVERARRAARERRWDEALALLGRAHVLGQAHVVPHVRAHALMLAIELRRRALGGAAGQLLRIVLGAIGSAVGRVPTGNTGASDVSMFMPMPVPDDLRALLSGGEP
jgi:hypothetical protein